MEGTPIRGITGVAVSRVLTREALGPWAEGDYLRGFYARLGRALGLLWQAYPQMVCDLRLLSSGRSITLGLLVRDGAGATPDPPELCDLLAPQLPEYVLGGLVERDLERLLSPFPVGAAFVLQIQGVGAHLARVPGLGVSATDSTRAVGTPGASESVGVWGRYALQPGRIDWRALTDFLLRLDEPLLLSVRLEPTQATRQELGLLEHQLELLQRVLPGIPAPARRAVGALYRHLWNWRLRLDGPLAHSTLTLASALPRTPGAARRASSGQAIAAFLGGEVGLLELNPLEGDELAEAAAALRELRTFSSLWTTAPLESLRLPHLLGPTEAAAVVPLPPASHEPYPGIPEQRWRRQPLGAPGTENRAIEGAGAPLHLGRAWHRGTLRWVGLEPEDLRRHLYVVGQTGTGKTTLLSNLALEALERGHGLCVVDPHGDLYQELLGQLPPERAGDLICIDPTDLERPVGLNLLEARTPEERHAVVQEFSEILFRLIVDEYGSEAASFMGPVFFHHLRMNLLLVTSDPDRPGTLLDVYNLFQEEGYWRRWLPLKCDDPLLRRWVEENLPKQEYTALGSDKSSFGNWVASKLQGLVFDPLLRSVFDQPRSSVDLDRAMQEGKVLLVNLAKGSLGIQNARFFGMVFLSMLYAAALRRVRLPQARRRDFLIVVDEFQSLATANFANLLSEGRKFGVSLVLANQYLSQVKDSRVREALLGNAGTLVAFRLGWEDAGLLEGSFYPAFTRYDLVNLPNWTACVRPLSKGQAASPFTLHVEPTARRPLSTGWAQQMARRSRERYGRPVRPAEPKPSTQPEPPVRAPAPEELDRALQEILAELRGSPLEPDPPEGDV